MLVSQETVDGEARLVTHTQPAVTEHVQTLGLGGQQDLSQPGVTGLESGDLVDDDLSFHRHTQAVAGTGCGRGPHHSCGEDYAVLGVGDLDPPSLCLVESSDWYQSHLSVS